MREPTHTFPRHRSLKIVAAWLGLLTTACGDAIAPNDGPTLTSTSSVQRPEVLARLATAPTLESYDTTFWAIQGRATNFLVNYALPDPLTGDVQRFLKVAIPQQTQLTAPDGTPLSAGDSLLISVKLDQTELAVELGPHGTGFGEAPAELTLWYTYADLSGAGARSESDLAVWYQGAIGEPWFLMNGTTVANGDHIVVRLDHFSNYIVAWGM